MEYIRIAWQQIKTNTMRSLLTMLGIVIGIASMIAVISVGDGGEQRVKDELEKFGLNRIWMYTSNYRGANNGASLLNMNDVEALRAQVPEAAAVCPASYRTAYVSAGSKRIALEVMGTDQSLPQIEPIDMQSGRFLSQQDISYGRNVVVLSSQSAKEFFPTGDPVQQKVRIQGKTFTVIGVEGSKSITFAQQDSSGSKCYIPISAFENVFNAATLDEISVIGDDPDSVEALAQTSRDILRERHRGSRSIKMVNLAKEMTLADNILDTFGTVVGAIAAVSLLVGGIGIMNIMLVTVKERTQEIGVRKALGARNSQILGQFLTETLVYTLLGAALGVALGCAFTTVFSNLVQIQAQVQLRTVLLSSGFALLIGLFFGIYPAMKAASLNPVEALRRE